MYCPKAFEQQDLPKLRALIAEYPLAQLVVLTSAGLVANPIPLFWRESGQGTSLVGHVARANPVWQDFDPKHQALAIFSGPQHYISPIWYPTKQEHGRVVPTWNYAQVQVKGTLQIHQDKTWLRQLLDDITDKQEAGIGANWRLSDAPPEYIEKMIGAVIGIEIPIVDIRGKWKLSQNQPEENKAGVVVALKELDTTTAKSLQIAMSTQLED